MLKKLVLLLLFSFSFNVNAFQIKTATEGVLLDFDISAQELTHIMIENDRIIGIKSAVDGLSIDREEERGHVFIRVNGIPNPIQAFILTEAGNTIGVRLTPQDIPAETIKIKPYREVALLSVSDEQETMLTLIERLYHQVDLENESSDTVEPLVVLGIKAEAIAQLQDDNWVAFKYLFENTHDNALDLLESDFARPNVQAVAIEKKSLQPGEITTVYIVKRR